MTLTQLLGTLANNAKLYITLTDKSGSELITFNAAGYASVEGDLGSRVVERITLESQAKIVVSLADAV